MSRSLSLWISACLGVLPMAVFAQSMDMQNMQNMPGMVMPPATDTPAPTHDQHDAAPTKEDAQHATMDHSGHDMSSMPGMAGTEAKVLPPNDHVPPPSPQSVPHDMTPAQMNAMMQMDDNASLGMFTLDRLERSRSTSGDYATSWEAEGWYGNAINRLWLKTEGERDSSGTQDGRVEALWSHAFASFWDWQLGARHDFGQGPDRQWLAAGVEGLAPYWFETQATFYVGEEGRTALRLETSYDMRFTQRLILTPQVELNFYGKDDPRRGISSGLSNVEAGMRLRYEFSRKFAPYVGVNWTRRFGSFNDMPGVPEVHARETTWVAGVRIWL
ncbi:MULTISPECIES: copper resistance protein B [unclassified Dyella]|uniref:copper resistance protein B n=1 Tax=unclassified Dyella TaxID=2634549 RepID=UPI000C830100|nr:MULTISPECIES: copper resistance protein B [unclassified Dyella]MDR3446159.1 copper resistance protein B [Dyella sp.]PMQ04431.1 Copper resistance protein B [Dyella sp. AD56]